VLLRRDVVDLGRSTSKQAISQAGGAERSQCGWPGLAYHLAVGEEGDGLGHVGGAAVAHARVEHGLGDVLGVVTAVPPVELVLQVVDAVLFLVPRNTRAPCNKKKE
jgi:hypothetical protein